MDTVLQGIPGVTCYIDDILVSGKDEKQHLQILEEVFRRLEEHEFHLKQEKCEFFTQSVEYLGHAIDQEGIRPLPSKVAAIVKAPAPTNLQELRSFLGLLNYYSKFILNLATIIHPLNELLQTDRKWRWSEECAEAFVKGCFLARSKALILPRSSSHPANFSHTMIRAYRSTWQLTLQPMELVQ